MCAAGTKDTNDGGAQWEIHGLKDNSLMHHMINMIWNFAFQAVLFSFVVKPVQEAGHNVKFIRTSLWPSFFNTVMFLF